MFHAFLPLFSKPEDASDLILITTHQKKTQRSLLWVNRIALLAAILSDQFYVRMYIDQC